MSGAVAAEIKADIAVHNIVGSGIKQEAVGIVRKILVDNTLGGHPQAFYVTVMEHSRELLFRIGKLFRRQSGVVLHKKMQVKSISLLRPHEPFFIKPMETVFGVAVEPKA